MNLKLIKWALVKGSLKMNTPRKRVMVGERYCTKPTVDKETLFAPLANHNRGTAVTIPEQISSKVVWIETVPMDPVPLT